jgi:hypothetical protein
MPATRHDQAHPSSQPVIANGSHKPTDVCTRPRIPAVMYRAGASTARTLGPHSGHASVSIKSRQTAAAGA